MPIHQTLILAAFILLIIAALFDLPIGTWPNWSHFFGWLALALYVLSGVI